MLQAGFLLQPGGGTTAKWVVDLRIVWRASPVGTVLLTGVLMTACSTSPGSPSALANQQSTLTACSLLTAKEATILLGGTPVSPMSSRTTSCSYPGRAASIIILQVRRNNLPECVVNQNCTYSAGVTKATVNSVKADWVPATSVQAPNSTPQPGAANTGSLLFYHRGAYVNISVENVSSPQSIAERTMAIVLGRL